MSYALGAYRGKGTGELPLFSEQLEALSEGDLLLGDCYYCTYALIAELDRRSIPVVFQCHAQRQVDFRRGQRLGTKDHLVHWCKPVTKPVWMSVEQYRALPSTLTVRELAVGSKVYVTTLVNEKRYGKKAIAQLYCQRWSAELDLRSLKSDLRMDKLRCQSPSMVRKEIAVRFLGYNFIRAAMVQAALCYHNKPRWLSFKATVRLLEAMKTQLLELSVSTLGSLLQAISSTGNRQRRRAPQPRAVKQRPKPYPRLKVPRKVVCHQLVDNFN